MMNRRIAYLVAALCITASASSRERTVTLSDCRSMAMQNSAEMKNAGLDILSAKALKQEALSEFFPKVSMSSFGFHALNPLLDIGVTDILGHSDMAYEIRNYVEEMAPQYDLPTRYRTLRNGYGAMLSVTQPIFAGGRIVTGNRLAAINSDVAVLKKEISSRQIREDVEEKYWRVVSLEEKLLTIDNASCLLDTLRKDAESAFAAGLVTDADILQVRLKQNELRSNRMQVLGGIRLAKMDLFNLIGMDYSPVRTLADSLRPWLDDIRLSDRLNGQVAPRDCYVPEEKIAANMAESKLLSRQVEAAALQKRMAVGEALPQLAIGGTYGYAKYIGDARRNGAVFALVQIPVSDWGKISKRAKRLEYERQKAENQREYLDSQLILQARKLWIDLNTNWDQMQVAAESVEVAGTTLKRMQSQYNAGLVTMSDVLQAQTALRQTEDSYIDHCIAYRTALNEYLSRTESAGGMDGRY